MSTMLKVLVLICGFNMRLAKIKSKRRISFVFAPQISLLLQEMV